MAEGYKMKVGDLVRVRTNWGGNGTVGLITKIKILRVSTVVTLDTGWEYRVQELEVISESR